MLLHGLNHGGVEEHVIRLAQEQGRPLPAHIAEPPRPLPGLGLYLDAFTDLRTCAFENGPIPWTAVTEWARHFRLDARQTAALHHHVRALDRAFLEWLERKRQTRESRAVRKGNGRSR